MHTVSATRTIDSPVGAVWNVIDDFGNVHRYHPGLKHSEGINDVATGVGAERRCDFYDGNTIHEELIERVPERRAAQNVFDLGSLPLETVVGSMDLEPIDGHSTEVTMTLSFVPKYGPVGWLMAKLMMERQLRGLSEDILAGLDTHLQTGEVVGPNGAPETEDAGSSAMAAETR